MRHIYFCACSPEGGIEHYLERDGKLSFCEHTPLDRPMYMVIDGWRAYVLLREVDPVSRFGGMIAFEIDADGRLVHPTPVLNTQGIVPCHLAAGQGDIYAVNYLSGNIIRFPDVVRGHTGSGPNVERQEAPHTHFVEISDDGSEVYCVDLGLDTIFVYDRELNEKARIRLPSGYGPRHLVFSEDRKAMFCVYELANAVSMLKRIGEEWKVVDTVPLLEQPGNGGAAAIRIFEDELYVSVRGADVLVRLKILDTKLQVLNRISCGGASPRDFDWIDGRLYCANENSNTVTIFQRDGENFVRLSDTLSMPHPLCVCALRD